MQHKLDYQTETLKLCKLEHPCTFFQSELERWEYFINLYFPVWSYKFRYHLRNNNLNTNWNILSICHVKHFSLKIVFQFVCIILSSLLEGILITILLIEGPVGPLIKFTFNLYLSIWAKLKVLTFLPPQIPPPPQKKRETCWRLNNDVCGGKNFKLKPNKIASVRKIIVKN